MRSIGWVRLMGWVRWMGALVAACALMACGRSSEPAAKPTPPARASTSTEPVATSNPTEPPSTAPAASNSTAAAPPTPTERQEPEDPARTTAATDEPATAKKKPGRIKLVHQRPKKARMRALADELQQSKLFAEVVGELDKLLELPQDLAVHFEDCGEINAFYDPEKKKVSMCWELLEHTVEQFSKEATSEEEAVAGFIHATVFTFFHELGHALVDLLDLPITGKEEDVVDQLATWFLVAGGEEGALMAIDGALSFLDEEGDDEPATWGEHSLDQQRFYNIVCWVYGSNPERFGELTERREGPLPDERAELCPDEWQRMSRSWERLLADHIRK